MNAYPRREHLFVWRSIHALGRDCDLMTAVSKGVREIEHVPFLTTDVRREELG